MLGVLWIDTVSGRNGREIFVAVVVVDCGYVRWDQIGGGRKQLSVEAVLRYRAIHSLLVLIR
jgi:hypothetical protein